MSRFGQLPGDSSLDELAAEWLVEQEEGSTPERAEAFAAWCRRDPRHAEAVARVKKTLALFEEMPAIRVQLEAKIASINREATPHGVGRIVRLPRLVWISGLAAVLTLGFGIWWKIHATLVPVWQYGTNSAVQRSLVLSDRSVMDIDIDSAVSTQFTVKERRVTLIRGQAYFQVAHNPARPFIVIAGNFAVRAVGTAFSVRLTAHTVDVLVENGKVELANNSVSVTAPSTAPLLQLRTGERANLPLVGGVGVPRIVECEAQAIRAMLTWRSPLTSFTDVPLRDVVKRLNRRNVTQLVIEDERLGDRKIGGTINLSQVDAFVRLLEESGDVAIERLPSGEIGLRQLH